LPFLFKIVDDDGCNIYDEPYQREYGNEEKGNDNHP
jgi:hypothetical protein